MSCWSVALALKASVGPALSHLLAMNDTASVYRIWSHHDLDLILTAAMCRSFSNSNISAMQMDFKAFCLICRQRINAQRQVIETS